MALDFDQLPFYDPLLKSGSNKMSEVWIGAFSTFYQTLIGYLSQNGMFLPLLTGAQRDEIQSPVNGQWIYNTDTDVDAPQFYQLSSASWRTISFT